MVGFALASSPIPINDVDDTTSWHRLASRATHPSAVGTVLDAGDLLGEIAAGLGRVTVPLDLVEPTTTLRRELVLTTPAYDVWVMSWPAGMSADLHTHDRPVAFHVVSGSLVEERYEGAVLEARAHVAGSTSVVPPSTPHRITSSAATTTVHVHAKEHA